MKLHVIVTMLLAMSFTGLQASNESSRSNTPNLTQIYTILESNSERSKGNRMHFYAVAGTISEYAEQIKEPQQQKCAAHILSLMNAMSLTISQEKRAEHLQKFSNKYAECDQFVPDFLCKKNNAVMIASTHN